MFGYGFRMDSYYGYDDDGAHHRWESGESMSKATKRKLEEAKTTFLDFLAKAEIPAGEDKLQVELIKHHITQPAFLELNKLVKAHGCTAKQRQISDAEKAQQKGSEKTKKTNPKWTSVTVTRAAQEKYRKELAEKQGGKRAAGGAAGAGGDDEPKAKAARK